jgi:hypothetical protein
MDFLSSPAFWLALGQIIIIDILLGGDNAVVIALACRKLPGAGQAAVDAHGAGLSRRQAAATEATAQLQTAPGLHDHFVRHVKGQHIARFGSEERQLFDVAHRATSVAQRGIVVVMHEL